MRLIDADALKTKGYEEAKHMGRSFNSNFGMLVDWLVSKAPTVDAEPVRYGMWSTHPVYKEFEICNKCGVGTRTIYKDKSGVEHKYSYRYCPHCGAKMDE